MKWVEKHLYGSNLVFQAHVSETWSGWLLHTSISKTTPSRDHFYSLLYTFIFLNNDRLECFKINFFRINVGKCKRHLGLRRDFLGSPFCWPAQVWDCKAASSTNHVLSREGLAEHSVSAAHTDSVRAGFPVRILAKWVSRDQSEFSSQNFKTVTEKARFSGSFMDILKKIVFFLFRNEEVSGKCPNEYTHIIFFSIRTVKYPFTFRDHCILWGM